MQPAFLLPESTLNANGEGAAVALDPLPASVVVTLGITHVVEQEALMVTIHSSTDGATWDPHPLGSFSQKFYTGVSSVLIDLSKHPDLRFLRAQWKVQRWGRGDKTPSFTFYIFAEPA